MFPNDKVVITKKVNNEDPNISIRTYSSNVEFNRSGHKIYVPSDTHILSNFTDKYGEEIGKMIFSILGMLGVIKISVFSYSIIIGIRKNEAKLQDDMIDSLVNNAINSVVLHVSIEPGMEANLFCFRSTKGPIDLYFPYVSGFDQCKTIWRSTKQSQDIRRYLASLGEVHEAVFSEIFEILGIEEVSIGYSNFSVELAECYLPIWDSSIKPAIKMLLWKYVSPNIIYTEK